MKPYFTLAVPKNRAAPWDGGMNAADVQAVVSPSRRGRVGNGRAKRRALNKRARAVLRRLCVDDA